MPARALGYRPIGDYKENQLGIQAEYGGAIMVDGTWYCPSMPQPLIDASKDHRAGRINDDVYDARIGRVSLPVPPETRPHPGRQHQMDVPGPRPRRNRRLRARRTVRHRHLGMPTTRTRILNPPADPDICCTNKTSITIPIAPTRSGNSNIAKYFQDIPYKSPEWKAHYAHFRNTIEGFNGFTKLPTEEDSEQPARRRIRGYAYQALAVALNILASNLRKIASWLNRTGEQPTPAPTTPRPRRANAAPDLADYLPDPNGPPLAIPA